VPIRPLKFLSKPAGCGTLFGYNSFEDQLRCPLYLGAPMYLPQARHWRPSIRLRRCTIFPLLATLEFPIFRIEKVYSIVIRTSCFHMPKPCCACSWPPSLGA
jgi:hypothetical protein